jgi:hypothetical protein
MNLVIYLLFGLYFGTMLTVMFSSYKPSIKVRMYENILLAVLCCILYPIAFLGILIREVRRGDLVEVKLLFHLNSWYIIPYPLFSAQKCSQEVKWLCTTVSWRRR